MNRMRIGWILSAILLAVLIAAWIDGGREPLHPIEKKVELPGGAA